MALQLQSHGKENPTINGKTVKMAAEQVKGTNPFIDAIEKFLSPAPEELQDVNELDGHKRRPPKVLLHDCKTPQEHFEKVDTFLEKVKDKHGIEGLRIGGFDYVAVSSHDGVDVTKTDTSPQCCTKLLHKETKTIVSMSNRKTFIADGTMYEEIVRLCQEYVHSIMIHECNMHWVNVCTNESKGSPIRILVSSSNKKMPEERSNHDGEVDDDISTSIVDEDCELSFEDDEDGTREPVLVAETVIVTPTNDEDDNLSDDDDDDDGVSLAEEDNGQQQQDSPATPVEDESSSAYGANCLIITTSKGKLQAGIFSRQHLLVSSIESSTALPIVREARRRGMKVALLDPNARGERNGTTTYEQSMRFLFGTFTSESDVSAESNVNNPPKHQEEETEIGTKFQKEGFLKEESIYFLAHSVSGSQLSTYLMTEGGHTMPRIKSLVFTDSTHNIKWFEKKEEHSKISLLFQSSASLYVRSSNRDRDENCEKHKAGDECDTDQYWKHRFGDVKTIWAGTEDHSLTNWAAHSQIWTHFDRILSNNSS